MEKSDILKIVKEVKDTSNSKITEARDYLISEYDKTKELIVNLTRHLDTVEEMYNKLNDELKNRTK